MDYTKLSDRTLIDSCMASPADERAWKEFYRRFHPIVFAFIVHWCRKNRVHKPGAQHVEEYQDLCHDVLLKLVKNNCKALRVFQNRNDKSIYSYLMYICRNTVINYGKKISSKKRKGRHTSLSDPIGRAYAEDEGFTLEDVLPSQTHDLQEQRKLDELCEEIAGVLMQHWPGKHKQRDILIYQMSLLGDMPAEEIATLPSVNLSHKRVRNIITDIKKVLVEHLPQRTLD